MSTGTDRIAALTGLKEVRDWVSTESGSIAARIGGRQRPAVADTPELRRVLALPRRKPLDLSPESVEAQAVVELMTRRLRRERAPWDRCACASYGRECITRLNPVQAWTLFEAPLAGGVFGSIGVGDGKCLAGGSEYFDIASGRRRDVSEPGPSVVMTVSGNRLFTGQAVAFPSGKKQCVRTTLADGASLILSWDHPVLTGRGWVKAADLQPKADYAAVPTFAHAPLITTTATDDEVSLIAFLMSDGNTTQATPRFTNMTPDVIAEFQRCASAVCGGWSEQETTTQAREFSVLGSGDFRKKWGLYGLSKEKRVHASLWGLPSRQVALFLNRFWACDGHVSRVGLEITLASEDLIDDLRFMLLRLGVRSRKSSRFVKYNGTRLPAYRLAIRGTEAEAFLATVGDVLGKEASCVRLRSDLAATARNTNTDIVPLSYYDLQVIYDELRIQRGEGRHRVRLLLGAQTKTRVSRKRFIEFAREYRYQGRFSHLATEGVGWELVTAVEPVGELDVYDLSVPGTHNFVANNIVVHNTGIDILISVVMLQPTETAVLFVPPRLREQLHREYLLWREHFRVPSFIMDAYGYWVDGAPVLRVIPYSKFSREESTDLLKRLKPKLVIGDEAHYLRHRDTARTGRALSYFAEDEQGATSAWWTGSPTASSIKDFTHLAALALADGSPLPTKPQIAEEWSLAVDPIEYPAPAGALKKFCEGEETVREGLRRRIVETLGFISTRHASLKIPLIIEERRVPAVPDSVGKLLDELRNKWRRPDGEELVDRLAVARSAGELSCGFFNRWRFPRGESRELIYRWYELRKAWHKELRDHLKSRIAHMDSPLLATKAAIRAYRKADDEEDEWVSRYLEREGFDEEADAEDSGRRPKWRAQSWPAWRDICDQVYYEPEAVWVDDFLARDAAQWGLEHRGLVWFAHAPLGERIAQLSGLPLYRGGDPKKDYLPYERGDRSVVLSINAYGTGTDGLQRIFSEQLATTFPSSADRAEQLLGRLHRPYQAQARVRASVYRHTIEAAESVDRAFELAKYIEGIMGTHQKLLQAECRFSKEAPR